MLVVDLSLLASFKRVQDLCKSVEEVAGALESSQLLVLSEDKSRVRRSQPFSFTLQQQAQVDERIVNVVRISLVCIIIFLLGV